MSGTEDAEISHGRGGLGNIGPDDSKYVDGEITRSGAAGSHQDGAFSTGRGGAANIGDAGTEAPERQDKDIVPAEATRPSQDTDYHVGRGGAGNEHHANTTTTPTGLADKLKYRLSGMFGKKKA